MEAGEQRLIIATCEKGTVEDVSDMREIKKGVDAVKKANPNLAEISAREVFKPVKVDVVADAPPRANALNFLKKNKIRDRARLIENRPNLKIGIPRVLNMYSTMPFFMGYFQSLGLDPKQIIYSDYTTEELYKEGAKRGSIDPCFPSKVGIPHVHNLLYHKHKKHSLTHIFFPMIDSMPTFLKGVQSSKSCPTVATSTVKFYAF